MSQVNEKIENLTKEISIIKHVMAENKPNTIEKINSVQSQVIEVLEDINDIHTILTDILNVSPYLKGLNDTKVLRKVNSFSSLIEKTLTTLKQTD